jgi:HSP20 family protein
MPPRDPFGNLDRIRRDIDELFGDVLERHGPARTRGGFSPSVDVYYYGDPPKAVVEAELAGIDSAELGLEIRGRELIITGRRRRGDSQRRAYQQLEIESGPFRRVIALGAEVQADRATAAYRDGILRVELPLALPAQRARTVTVEVVRRGEER